MGFFYILSIPHESPFVNKNSKNKIFLFKKQHKALRRKENLHKIPQSGRTFSAFVKKFQKFCKTP